MRRRDFIGFCGSAAAAWPLVIHAQQGRGRRIPNVGILNYAAADDALVSDFRTALGELGYVEGHSLTVTYRWADGNFASLPGLAADRVANNVDGIIALGPATWAAKAATNNVPIVIAFSGDPVGNGVVSNLARPGGNITGFSYMSTDLAAKRIELLSKTFPKNRRIGILYNPAEPATVLEMRETEAAARGIGVALHPLAVGSPEDLNGRFAAAVREQADALIVFTHGSGVVSSGTLLLSDSAIDSNSTAISGAARSSGNNRIFANSSDGTGLHRQLSVADSD